MPEMRRHLGRKLALYVLHLSPEHEGLQDLMQAMDDDHALLHGNIILPARSWSSLAKAIPEPLCKLVLVIKHLQQPS